MKQLPRIMMPNVSQNISNKSVIILLTIHKYPETITNHCNDIINRDTNNILHVKTFLIHFPLLYTVCPRYNAVFGVNNIKPWYKRGVLQSFFCIYICGKGNYQDVIKLLLTDSNFGNVNRLLMQTVVLSPIPNTLYPTLSYVTTRADCMYSLWNVRISKCNH